MTIRFGTDGWRAVISETFTFGNLRLVAQAIADYILEENQGDPSVVVGFDTRFLGEVQMKGKEQPVEIYECFSGDDPAMIKAKLDTLDAFKMALGHYFAREFEQAAALLEEMLKACPEDGPARLFHRKARQLIMEGVPEGWTGVERMQVK